MQMLQNKSRNSSNKNIQQTVFSFSIFPDSTDSLEISYVRILSLILKHGDYSQKKPDHLTHKHM